MAQVDYLRTRARALASLFGEVVPERFGRNRVVKRLGEGAMGIVYLATDASLGRDCAIKVLHVADGDADRDLLREARALAALSHPNVVQIYEIARYEHHTCIVMEYVDGPTLRAWLAERPRTVAEIIDVFARVGDGLAAAHARGLVHRDFKPDNVLIGASTSATDVRPRVVDFGLARVHADSPTPPDHEPTRTSGLATLTTARVGTPAYMAPEQHEGAVTDARCDQYAFCVSLYEALQGERPFAGKTSAALLDAKSSQRPGWPRRVPVWLRAVVERGLSPRPGDRFPHLDALLERLRARARPRVALVIAAAGVAAVAWATVMPSDDVRCEAGETMVGAVWNPEREEQIAASFAATALPYATEAADRVRTALDHRAVAWAEVYDEMCTAGRDDAGPSDARMTCLRRQRDALAELVDALAVADAKVVEHALSVAESAPDAAKCRDVVASDDDIVDDERRAALDALHARLAGTLTRHRLGRLDEAWALATDLLVDARASGDDALLAQVLFQIASIADDRGDYPEAESLLYESAAIAMQARRDDLVADAQVELVLVAGERQDRGQPIDDLMSTAEAALQRAGDPPEQRMRFHEFVGAAMVARGRNAEAMPHYEEALALAEAIDGPEATSVASICSNFGHAKLAAGEPEAAIALFDRADRITTTRLPGHPGHAGTVTNRAIAYLQLARFDEALVDQRRSLTMKLDMLGPTHPRLCTTLAALAQTLDQLGQREAALVYAGWGYAIVSAHPEMADGREAASMLIAWATLMQHLGVDDEAERALQRAAESMRLLQHPQLSVALANLANLAYEREDYARAEQLVGEALAVLEPTSSEFAPPLATMLRTRAKVRTKSGDHDGADADLRRALAIAEHNHDTLGIRRVLTLFGDLELARGRPREAADYRAREEALAAASP
jgi:eukaryotic-like serine/threonine-protein kinase